MKKLNVQNVVTVVLAVLYLGLFIAFILDKNIEAPQPTDGEKVNAYKENDDASYKSAISMKDEEPEWMVESHTIIGKILKEEYTVGYKYFFELSNGVTVEVTEEEYNKFTTGDVKFMEFCYGQCTEQYRELGSE